MYCGVVYRDIVRYLLTRWRQSSDRRRLY